MHAALMLRLLFGVGVGRRTQHQRDGGASASQVRNGCAGAADSMPAGIRQEEPDARRLLVQGTPMRTQFSRQRIRCGLAPRY